jgi:hypothetical protein
VSKVLNFDIERTARGGDSRWMVDHVDDIAGAQKHSHGHGWIKDEAAAVLDHIGIDLTMETCEF